MNAETRIERLTASLLTAQQAGLTPRETAIAVLACVDSLEAEQRAANDLADRQSVRIIGHMMQLGDMCSALKELHVAIRRAAK